MKRKFFRFITALMATLTFLTAVPLGAAPAFASEGNRTVRVGFFAYPGYHEQDGSFKSGYGYEFLSLLQRYTNLNYEYVGYENSWEDMQRMLADGEIDMVTSARKTSERMKKFDFSEPIGTNSAQINVRIDDERFIPGDYKALSEMVFGELKGNSRNDDFAKFASEYGLVTRVKIYETADELETALQNKQVDAIVSSSLRKGMNEKTVAEFAPEEFYVIVRKGNSELLKEINYGISQMDINEGNWRDDLYYRNYRSTGGSFLSFTKRERDYITAVKNGEKTVTVTAQPDGEPYSFVENGKLVGIIPDYFEHLMDMAGIPYTVEIAKDRSEFAQWMTTNHTDVIMDYRYGSVPIVMEEFGLVTDPYMTLTTSRVTKKGFTGMIHSIATVNSQGIDLSDESIAVNAEYLLFPTREEAMQAVSEGRADACYVYTYTAEKFMNERPDTNLQLTLLRYPTFDEYIYVSPNTDHELCSILNKCIKTEASGTLDRYVSKYTSAAYEKMTLFQYMQLHPEIIVIVSAVLLILIIVISVYAVSARTEKLRNAQLKQDLDRMNQIKGLASQFSVLYFVNLNTLETDSNYLDDAPPEEAKDIDKESENFFEAFKASMVQYAHPDYREELLKFADPAHVKEVLRNRRRYEYRFLCMNAQGGYSWTDMVLMKFSENDDDEPVNIAIGYYDTDVEMKERLEAFRRNERDLEAIRGLAAEFDTLQFVDLDSDSYSLYFMVDYSPDQAKELSDENKDFSQYFTESMNLFCHPDYKDELLRFADLDNIREVLSNQNKYTIRFLCDSDTGYKWCEFSLIRLDQEDVPKRVAVGYTNIDDTVRREMEYQKKLEAANKSKTDFLFNMSHDIRTPMNAIIGFTQLAKKHIDDKERTAEDLSKIEASGNHLLNLINEVLDMSRVEAGKLRSEIKTVNISEAATKLVSICTESAVKRDIELSYTEKGIMHRVVEADELHINQIIMNVLGNAIKYTEPGGRVSYTVEELKSETAGYGRYRLVVEDTGIGMSPEYLEHIFEAFSREEDASTSRVQGTGLGMSIVKRLVDHMNGSIDIESEKGRGTKVTIVLDLKIAEQEEQNAAEETHLVDFTGMKVLLVEDNEMNREIATEILEEQGLVIEEAVNGIEAVEKVREKGADYYDFVLMDIQMPVMDGYQATAEIRKLPGAESLPIIAVSANAFDEDKKKSIEAGMNEHVSKPIVVSELFEALSRHVR